MSPHTFKLAAKLQLAVAVVTATGVGCSPTQPFYLNESPDLQHYLNTATRIEYPDVDIDPLPDTIGSQTPLTSGNHEYEFWDLTLEECTSIALNNAKFFVTTGGNSETRQNVAAQFVSASADQVGSIYDVAVQQTTTQTVPLAIDGQGNRLLPRGVLRANQIGGVEDALAEFDAQASAFVSYNTTDRTRNTAIGNSVNPPITVVRDVTQQAAISKRFATGGVATLRQQIIYNRSNVAIDVFARSTPSDYTALVEAQVLHPLMRNRGTLINRIPVVLASLNEDIQLTDFEIQVRNLVRDVEVAYWDLYTAYRSVSTSIVARNSAQATAYLARLQFEQGAGTKQERAQADEQYFRFTSQLQGSLAGSNVPGDDPFGVYGRERELREKLGIAGTDGRLIRPVDEPTLARVEYDWEEATSELLYLSPELRRARFVIQQRELETKSALNQLLPEVNLSLVYRWVGQGDSLRGGGRGAPDAPAPGSNALQELTSGEFQEGAIRLEVTPPAIGGRRERARIRNSQLQYRRAKGFVQESERLLVSQLSGAVAKVATHYSLIQINANRWQAAETEVEARLKEFELGRSPINVVLQSQQRRADAELAYYRALGEYNKSLGYVDYLRGTSLANSNITLAEGVWNKKAYWDALQRARERSAGKACKYGVTRPNVVRRPMGDALTAHTTIAGGPAPAGLPGTVPMVSDTPIVPPRADMPLTDFGDTPTQMLDAPALSPPTLSPPTSSEPVQMPTTPAPAESLPPAIDAVEPPVALPGGVAEPSIAPEPTGSGIRPLNHVTSPPTDEPFRPVRRVSLRG